MLERLKAALIAFSDPTRVDSRDKLQLVTMRLKHIEKLLNSMKLDGKKIQKYEVSGLEAALRAAEQEYRNFPDRTSRVIDTAKSELARRGIGSGRMLEIGGRLNPRNADFPDFEYFALDLEPQPNSPVPVVVGDITNCQSIPSGYYDFIFSFDVFEHIDRPWLAASEITRLLRPGGLTFHSTLFSWRYHPCPIDYWRFSPEGLRSLFPDLECTHSKFDNTERRRNIIGRDGNRVKPDALGGWRENIRVSYAGFKPIKS